MRQDEREQKTSHRTLTLPTPVQGEIRVRCHDREGTCTGDAFGILKNLQQNLKFAQYITRQEKFGCKG